MEIAGNEAEYGLGHLAIIGLDTDFKSWSEIVVKVKEADASTFDKNNEASEAKATDM